MAEYDDVIHTYTLTEGRVYIVYRTSGELRMSIDGHCYKIQLDRSQNNINWMNGKFFKKCRGIGMVKTEQELEKIIAKAFENYRRAY